MIILDVAKDLKKNYGYEEIPTPELVNVIRDAFTSIAGLLKTEGIGSTFQVPRFGVFKIKRRGARIGFNPQTKEKINIPEKTIVSFRPSTIFREELSNIKTKKKATKKKKATPKKKASKKKK